MKFSYFDAGPLKETPDIAHLNKVASETQKKFENTESEMKRLQSKNSRMEEEVSRLDLAFGQGEGGAWK